MPELPEVETIRRYLESAIVGKSVVAVPHLDERMVKRSPLAAGDIRQRLTGQVFDTMTRKGKFLFLGLASGDALLVHLGMSGRLVVDSPDAPLRAHTHLIVSLGESEVRLSDPRRFGRIAWVPVGSPERGSMGIEPLSPAFGGEALLTIFKGRKVAVKTALLNQTLVAGLGNIYADEALYDAKIHPLRSAGGLDVTEAKRLVRAIKKVLRASIAHRGTSFSDYVDALGHPGENQDYLAVYGREGAPCRRCGQGIARLVIGGRSSHYCPTCQPATPVKIKGER